VCALRQIGLVDVLREEYGIVPAGMLGHSAGEIPAGYADGCLTLHQVRQHAMRLQAGSTGSPKWLTPGCVEATS
jgi:acyl transferase domain-containing protein